jgi:hypothetical protein
MFFISKRILNFFFLQLLTNSTPTEMKHSDFQLLSASLLHFQASPNSCLYLLKHTFSAAVRLGSVEVNGKLKILIQESCSVTRHSRVERFVRIQGDLTYTYLGRNVVPIRQLLYQKQG